MDADTLIVDMARDLRDALPVGCWLGMVHHGDPAYFNNGVMYIRNTPQAAALFEEVWRTWPVHETWLDNETLIAVLRKNPGRWTGTCVIGDEWNSTVNQNECRRPVVRAWHGYGGATDREASMALCLRDVASKERRGKGGPRTAAAAAPSARPEPQRPHANPVALDPVSPVDFRAALGRPLRVRWEGDQFVRSSLALVNRELCRGLLAAGDVELSVAVLPNPWTTLSESDDPRLAAVAARVDAELSGPPDVTIRHHFPPNWKRTEAGKLIVMQPWEFSHLPCKSWITGALDRTADG